MRLYTCYTPSHRPLLEQHFLPSLPAEFAIDRLRPNELSQRSTTGEFASDGFQATCLDKVDFIRDAIASEKEPFLFSDVDVRFYGPVVDDLLKCLGDADMAFQWDGPRGKECTGFMVIRPSAPMTQFWSSVRSLMADHDLMDQDAVHAELEFDSAMGTGEVKVAILPERYWTFGRNDKLWNPGMHVHPPTNLLMHHANWTVGVGNKLQLLREVKTRMDQYERGEAAAPPKGVAGFDPTLSLLPPPKRQYVDGQTVVPSRVTLDHVAVLPDGSLDPCWRIDPVIPSDHAIDRATVVRMLEDQRVLLTGHQHHPLPLAIVLQFWAGDKSQAIALARLLADLEPQRRDDVVLVLARQSGCPMDADLEATQLHVGKKFPVMDLVAKVDPTKKYPGVCYDAWASACDQLANGYYSGAMPWANAFFCEPDGCPLGPDWVDRLKRAHEETLLAGKRVTGPRIRFGGIDAVHQVGGHVNGSLVMHLSLWLDRPSLHVCPPEVAWDVVHGTVLSAEAGSSNAIRNEQGGRGLSEELYWSMVKESAWITSLKDGSAHHWARRMLEHEVEKRERMGRR